jgi:putative SOS response-associated peptidase YedK
MCGRINLIAAPEQIKESFDLQDSLDFQTSYNITPGQNILAIVLSDESIASEHHNQAVQFLWGLIPSWAKDRKISHSLINARAETLSEKPSFRSAFKHRRCIIPATGFFEWQQTELGKQAYHLTRIDQQLFGFAGLWEHWEQDGETLYSCTIVTREANALMQSIHTRMPVILKPQHYCQWLDHHASIDQLQAMLAHDGYDGITAVPVSNWVNNPRHNDAKCIEPVKV